MLVYQGSVNEIDESGCCAQTHHFIRLFQPVLTLLSSARRLSHLRHVVLRSHPPTVRAFSMLRIHTAPEVRCHELSTTGKYGTKITFTEQRGEQRHEKETMYAWEGCVRPRKKNSTAQLTPRK